MVEMEVVGVAAAAAGRPHGDMDQLSGETLVELRTWKTGSSLSGCCWWEEGHSRKQNSTCCQSQEYVNMAGVRGRGEAEGLDPEKSSALKRELLDSPLHHPTPPPPPRRNPSESVFTVAARESCPQHFILKNFKHRNERTVQ